MSMYGDALNKLDDSLFVKIEPGKPVTLRLLDHPWISQKQFIDKATGESRIVTQFHWPVWDYAQQRVRVLTQGKSVFKDIATACDTWPAGDTMPSPFDIIIKREGTGQFDTKYTVTAVPYQGTMPHITRADMPNMEEKSKGIPLMQVIEGKTPPTLPPTITGAAPEPARPTHRDMEPEPPMNNQELEGEPDTIITELPEGDVNLDDIPDNDDETTPAINTDDIPFDGRRRAKK